ncbi:MAG: hypothetical protein Q9160_003216 [Pyrenula sp. 1 TL-2023]
MQPSGSSIQKLSMAPMAQTSPQIHHASPPHPVLRPAEWTSPVTIGPKARARQAVDAATPLIVPRTSIDGTEFPCGKKDEIRDSEIEERPDCDDDSKGPKSAETPNCEREEPKLSDHRVNSLNCHHPSNHLRGKSKSTR